MNNKIIAQFGLLVTKAILGYIAIAGYIQQRYLPKKEISDLQSQHNAELIKYKNRYWNAINSNSQFKSKMIGLLGRLEDTDQQISESRKSIDIYTDKLINKTIEAGQTESTIIHKIDYQKKTVESLECTLRRSKIIKEALPSAKLLDLVPSAEGDGSVSQSGIFENLDYLLEQYRLFIANLSLDQIVIVYNLICFSAILMTISSLSFIFVGDYLIENLKLEIKYPKLAKYIQFKKRMNKHYLMFYVVSFFVIVILSIIGNLVMLIVPLFW